MTNLTCIHHHTVLISECLQRMEGKKQVLLTMMLTDYSQGYIHRVPSPTQPFCQRQP